MITVTKHGNKTVYNGKCSHCGCEIECSQEDGMVDRSKTNAPMYIHCPECGERIDLLSATIQCGSSASTSYVSGFSTKD